MKKTIIFLLLIFILTGLFFAIVFVDQPVSFNDANLENEVRLLLGHSGKPIYRSQLLNIVELNLSDSEISDLTGIEYFRNLEVLNLSNNYIENVSPLSTLHNLKILNLNNNHIVNLETANFASLDQLGLVSLYLDHNLVEDETGVRIRLSDISLLRNFPDLEELSLNDNHINDFFVLVELKKLHSLSLRENRIEDIGFLVGMDQLEKLNLRQNRIKDLSPVTGLRNLTYLNLHSNFAVESIIPIANLRKLVTLILRNVPVGDDIVALEKLLNLSYLNLRNCSVSDISVLASLMENGALQDRPESGLTAYLDILDNDLPDDPGKLKALVPYWDNIQTKHPTLLNFATLEAPEFSEMGGYYSEPLRLQIFTDYKNVDIYYTLDGSIPTQNSNYYHEPILLTEGSSDQEDTLSVIVVRSRLFAKDKTEVSPVITKSFFIGENLHLSSSMPVISLAINPEYLFDHEFGIYASGNYLQRGKKWERPAHIEFYENNGDLGFSKNIGIRIHGNVSRRLPQKSFRIYANVDYDNEKAISYHIFPGYNSQLAQEPLTTFETLLLRNSGTDDFRTMFRDGFVQSLVDHTSLEMQAFRPSILYLNGNYWGIYNIRERIDDYYISNHFDVMSDDVMMLEYVANIGLVGDRDDIIEYYKLYDLLIDNNIQDDEVYDQINSMMDVDNFIDYQIIQIYSANMDWPQNNNVFWRIKSGETNLNLPMGLDGRWRWILYDLDFSFHNSSLNVLRFATRDDESTFLLRSLLQNDEFRINFINRFADHLNSSFVDEVVIKGIDEIQLYFEPEIANQIKRWQLPSSLDEWYENIANMREFAIKRPEVCRKHFIDYFDLDGTYEIFVSADQNQGFITINSIDITDMTPGVFDTNHWSGVYFNNIPIRIKATPLPGYRFIRWESSIEINSLMQELDLIVDENVEFTAIFELDD